MSVFQDLHSLSRDLSTPNRLLFLIKERFPANILVSASLKAPGVAVLKMVAEIDPATPVVFCTRGFQFPASLEYRGRIVDASVADLLRLVRADHFRRDDVTYWIGVLVGKIGGFDLVEPVVEGVRDRCFGSFGASAATGAAGVDVPRYLLDGGNVTASHAADRLDLRHRDDFAARRLLDALVIDFEPTGRMAEPGKLAVEARHAPAPHRSFLQ